MTAVVVATVVGSMAAGCGTSGKHAAATTVASSVTTEPAATSTSAPWNRARAEAEVRAAYQNFRVKLRELGAPSVANEPDHRRASMSPGHSRTRSESSSRLQM